MAGTGRSGGVDFGPRIVNRVSDETLLPRPWTLDADGEALSPAECVLCPNDADFGGLCERCAKAEGR